jgi:formylglycine-generating enzyme required for sulfatase activity
MMRRRGVGKLFISYRRDDTQDITGRIYDRLAAHFGKASIFMDVDSIQLGADFRKILTDAVTACDVALVMIGRQWLTIADSSGAQRLDNPSDFVRIEIEAALARDIPVVPILTQNTLMPRESHLPTTLAQLAYRHGMDVRSDQHFGDDVEQLIRRLEPLMRSTPATPTAAPDWLNAAPPVSGYPLPVPPGSLTLLGFRGINSSGTPAIIPPLITIPAGPFLMGSDKRQDSEAPDDETPQYQVGVDAFQIAKYPVTVAEYALAVQAGAVREPLASYLDWSRGVDWATQLRRIDHSVVCVSWEGANAYIAWLKAATGQDGWRLPTEAEWEKAARWDPQRQQSRLYPWGDTFDMARANTKESDLQRTAPVGSYPASDAHRSGASPYGVEEMAGNVWECTSSLYRPYPYVRDDGREDRDSNNSRTLRGGSWKATAEAARATHRSGVDGPSDSDYTMGFRLAFTPGAHSSGPA